MSENRENRNIIVASLWKTQNGHFHTMPIDAVAYDKIQSAVELGGKFLIRQRTAAAIQDSKNPATAPVAYLEFVSKENLEAFNNQRATRNAQYESEGKSGL